MGIYSMWVHGNSAAMQFPGGGTSGFFSNLASGSTPGSMMRQVHGSDLGGGPPIDLPWTDVVGERTGPGISFRGQENQSNFFHFSVPTPAFINAPAISNVPNVSLVTVYILFQTSNGTVINAVWAFDGPDLIQAWPARIALTSNVNHSGVGGRAAPANSLNPPVSGADNVTDVIRYDLSAPHPMNWGLGISVQVTFGMDTTITFTSAGADFVGP